jgi:branched-chain amino acid transport system ATP-binding protein
MSTLLKTDGLTKTYGGLNAVDNVSFSVARGESVGIIGPNGAGKTTLFNLISGFEPPTAGSVRFAEREIAGEAPHRIARGGMARTFQTARPFPGLTVLENLMVGALSPSILDLGGTDEREAERRAIDIAVRLGLERWLDRSPEQNLPYGTLKLIEVGRAMALGGTCILLDEPFAGVSGSEAERLLEVIQRLNREDGIAVVVIEHKLKILMRLVGRVLVLDRAGYACEGSLSRHQREYTPCLKLLDCGLPTGQRLRSTESIFQ